MANYEFYSLCAQLVQFSKKAGLPLPTEPDPDNAVTKKFFYGAATSGGLSTKKHLRAKIVEHWQTMNDTRGQARVGDPSILSNTY